MRMTIENDKRVNDAMFKILELEAQIGRKYEIVKNADVRVMNTPELTIQTDPKSSGQYVSLMYSSTHHIHINV